MWWAAFNEAAVTLDSWRKGSGPRLTNPDYQGP